MIATKSGTIKTKHNGGKTLTLDKFDKIKEILLNKYDNLHHIPNNNVERRIGKESKVI